MAMVNSYIIVISNKFETIILLNPYLFEIKYY